jgi:hypothetical protein
MVQRQIQPRCSITIVNVENQVVPILDEGALITPSGPRNITYREYWTEEEDLDYTYRQKVLAPDGSTSIVEVPGQIHGNIGYELLVRGKRQKAVLRVDYFTVLPSIVNGALSLEYEPKSVTVTGSLKHGTGLRVDIELQAGLSDDRGRPEFKWLRVACR